MTLRIISALREPTAPYSRLEALVYDAIIAPGVDGLASQALDSTAGAMPRGARVLDVGCGGGHLLRSLVRQRPDLQCTGLDLSSAQLRRAAKRVPSATFVRGDAAALPFPEASFDLVVSVGSVKHWQERERGLAECARVLAGAGHLLVVELDRGCPLDHASRFVSTWRLPRAVKPLALGFFRTWIAGRSLDLVEARELGRTLPLSAEVTRLEGTSAWKIDAYAPEELLAMK